MLHAGHLRKLISWTLIAALICQPVAASASLAGSLPPTPSNGASLPAINVPAGGLFAQNANPASRYLIETDPRFANRANFISSDYFLQSLGIDFDAVGRRAGDGYLEARLVREQLFELTGRRFLAGYQSDNEQLLALYDAGVRVAREMQLQPGIGLSNTQVAALTSDIIWLQTETLTLADGSPHQALVPRVYLAKLKARDLNPNGSLIAGGEVGIYAANDINVQGEINAERGLSMAAANYLQRAGKLTAKTIDVSARKNIKLRGGKIEAQDIALAAGQNIEIARSTSGERIKDSLTQLADAAPSINATGNATLIADQDINLAGANISAGKQLALIAGNDLNINASARIEDWKNHSGDGQYQRQAVFYSGSTLKSGGDTILLANNDIKLIGSTLDSGNNLAAQGKNIVLLASVDQVAVQYSGGVSGKTKGSFASGNSSDERVSVSRLSAQGSIDLRAGTNPDPIDFDKLPPTAAGNIYSQGTALKAGQDINLQGAQIVLDAVTENRSSQSSYSNTGGGVRQYQRQAESSTATGGIIDAGNNLNLKSSGDTTIVGSAINAGQSASIQTTGKLALLAATSSSSEQIQDFKQGRKKATTLNYSDNEVRQLLSTITVGNSLKLEVGGDFNADIASADANGSAAASPRGKPQADRMTDNGIEKGESRQQVSITRTGKTDSNTESSEVRGKLSGQGIRAQANDSFAPGATIQGQAAVEQYLASGLIQVKNNPQIQATLTAPTPNGSPLTYQDPSGKLQLSVAGLARAQEVYNQLKLTETFDVKKFADAQTAQIVTLVAAVALTVMTGGAGATLIGATTGTMSATVANAAFIGMVSTMTGQLVAGASFGDAFAAGIKSGAISAISAGLTYGVNDALGLNAQIDATTGKEVTVNGVVQYGNEAATAFKALPALDKLGNSLFWQQAGLNATAQGALTALQGGRFQDSFMASAASSVGSNFNKAVGDWAQQNGFTAGDFSKVLLHAGIGAAQAGLTKQNIAAGAIGGATAELLSPLSDSLDAATGNKLAGELLTLGGSIAANQLLNGNADFASNMAAANQGLQTDRFNRQLHRDERQLAAKLASRSKGKYTQEQIEDAMRVLGNQDKGESVATGLVVNAANWQKEIYDTGAKWIGGADGKSLVQVLPQVGPELIAYVQQQTGDLASPYMPPVYVLPPEVARPGQLRDSLTQRPLDDKGRYTVSTVIEGKVYAPKYWPCGDTSCLTKNANLDTSDPATQTYLRAMDKKVLDDVGKAAAGVALVNPLGVIGSVAGATGAAASFAKGAIDGNLVSPVIETATSEGFQKYLEYVLKASAAAAVRITALIELGGGWEAFAARFNSANKPVDKKDVSEGVAK